MLYAPVVEVMAALWVTKGTPKSSVICRFERAIICKQMWHLRHLPSLEPRELHANRRSIVKYGLPLDDPQKAVPPPPVLHLFPLEDRNNKTPYQRDELGNSRRYVKHEPRSNTTFEHTFAPTATKYNGTVLVKLFRSVPSPVNQPSWFHG